jgi:hypothetical protein
MELWEKIAIGQIDDEIVEKAKDEVLNRWKNEGYDIEEIKKIDIDEFLNRFNIEEDKKMLIKEILLNGIKKDIIIAFLYDYKTISIKLINGLVIHDLDKMPYEELLLLYKRMRTADLKKLFFTRKNHFWYWQ